MEKIKEFLTKIIEEGKIIRNERSGDMDANFEKLYRWADRVKDLLEQNVSKEEADKFSKQYGAIRINDIRGNFVGSADAKINFLQTLLSDIAEHKDYWESKISNKEDASNKGIQETTERKEKTSVPVVSKKIFLVHGRDESMKEATARFLEKLKLEPIILHEQPNKGRTLIEKFTDYTEVGFAVVLLTVDDIGGIAGAKYEELSPRARQNVILELGYFLGKIGRRRVCALYQEKVEIPSDYSGVLFIELDDRGTWRMQLAKEIKAAGIDVDMNKVI
jgi:predicted nucleotide-binding protein